MNGIYDRMVGSHDHESVVLTPRYRALRVALNDFLNDSRTSDVPWTAVLDMLREMALTQPYVDRHSGCSEDQWPHQVLRDDDRLHCEYVCLTHQVGWACSYRVDMPERML